MAMRFLSGRLILLVLIWFVSMGALDYLAPHEASAASTLLTTRHKYEPEGVGSRSPSPDRAGQGVVTLTDDEDIKQKPAGRRGGWAALPIQRKLSAKSAIIIDGRTGATIYAQAPDLPRQPASTIKVLTGLIALKALKGSEKISPSRHAVNMPRSKIYLRQNSQYLVDDLVNAVLLASANDASVALAEKIAGSEAVFASLMTHKARQLGARNTVCRTATGLTSRGQQSTARDLALIFNQAMEHSGFAARVARSKVKTSYGKVLWNHNKALWQVTGAEGGKTGYTRAARQTYVGKFSRNGEEIVVALMGSETMWDDVKRLVEYGFANKQPTAHGKSATAKPQQVVPARHLYAADQDGLRILSDFKKVSQL